MGIIWLSGWLDGWILDSRDLEISKHSALIKIEPLESCVEYEDHSMRCGRRAVAADKEL